VGESFTAVNMVRPLLSSSFIGARDQKPKTQDDCEECYGSYDAPSEHTGIILIAEIKHNLPKPGHLGLGQALYKHRGASLAFLRGHEYSTSVCALDSLQGTSE
jgi:hypothetical protein